MRVVYKLTYFAFVKLRIFKYQLLSDCKRLSGKPSLFHPLLVKGRGKISFGTNVQIGVIASPCFYSHYTYLEARTEGSEICIGNNVAINNGFSAVAFSRITIGNNVLIGDQCSIIDTDGHSLAIDKRMDEEVLSLPVSIGDNVFIGSNVSILKGVTIGVNVVIGKGSIVTQSIQDNVVVAGNPARVIRKL